MLPLGLPLLVFSSCSDTVNQEQITPTVIFNRELRDTFLRTVGCSENLSEGAMTEICDEEEEDFESDFVFAELSASVSFVSESVGREFCLECGFKRSV